MTSHSYGDAGVGEPLPGRSEGLPQLQSVLQGFQDSVAAQVAAGERLGELVRDQVADGQVETLTILEAGTLGLRREAQRLAELATGVEQRLVAAESRLVSLVDQAADRLSDAAAAASARLEEAADQAARQAASDLAEMERRREDALDEVSRLAQERREALDQDADALTARLAEMHLAAEQRAELHESALVNAVSVATERVADALEALSQTADERVQHLEVRLAADTEALVDQLTSEFSLALKRSLDELSGMGSKLTSRVGGMLTEVRAHAAGTTDAAAGLAKQMAAHVQDSTVRLVQDIDEASEALASTVASERVALDQRITGLIDEAEALLARWGHRESVRAARLEARAGSLHDRVDSALTQASQQLAEQTEVLAQRDAMLERARVEEFVRVLDALISRPGARGLRNKVTKILGERKDVAPRADAPVQPTQPSVTAPTQRRPAAGPPVIEKAPDKKAPVEKAPVTATSRKKAPAKKAPAKKAPVTTTPRKRAPAAKATKPVRRPRNPPEPEEHS